MRHTLKVEDVNGSWIGETDDLEKAKKAARALVDYGICRAVMIESYLTHEAWTRRTNTTLIDNIED